MRPDAPIPWTQADAALLRFWEAAEHRLRALVSQAANSQWRAAYLESRLQQVRDIAAGLQAKQRAWLLREVPRAYREAERTAGQAVRGSVPPFSAIDEATLSVLVESTFADTAAALESVAPTLERVFIQARQEMITAEQLQTQIAAGLVEGLPPRELAKRLQQALREGATEQLKGRIAEELRESLKATAAGQFITLRCRDGKLRRYALPYYSRMVAHTTRAAASAEGSLRMAREYGLDLVRISVHVGACPTLCLPIQGQVYSISGQTPGFPPLIPEVRTPLHPFCGHRMYPTSVEIMEADGSLEGLRRFSADPAHVVTNSEEYEQVLSGASRGVSRAEAVAEAREVLA